MPLHMPCSVFIHIHLRAILIEFVIMVLFNRASKLELAAKLMVADSEMSMTSPQLTPEEKEGSLL